MPEPEWARHEERRLQTHDGVLLRVQSWRPLTAEPAAAVLIVHGLKDHSDRYAEFAHALVDAGAYISGVLGRPPVSRAGKALLAKREKAAA